MFKKLALAAVAPVMAVGGLAIAGTANAAPPAWHDTSVQAICRANNLTAPFNNGTLTGLTVGASLALPTVPGATVTPASPVVPASGRSVTFTATDSLGSAEVETLTATAASATTVNLHAGSSDPDQVLFTGAVNNNSAGTVDFTTNPSSGLAFSLVNAPSGLSVAPTATGGSLSAQTAVQGPYNGVIVKAVDSQGAVATELCNIFVKGYPAKVHEEHPYVLHGKWTSRTASTATVSWDNSVTGNWMTGQNNGHGKCNEVYITGYGFAPLGDFADAHVGFTCDNGSGHDVGYLRGLLPEHTYAMRIVPATGDYGHHSPIPDAGTGYVDVFTLADF